VDFHLTSFPTSEIAKENKLSIQETARNLRHTWFENIRVKHNYQKIAIGHHINDSIETSLFHFSRGTGINGIRGILPISGKVVRPLMFLTNSEISEAVDLLKLDFRTDASNANIKYTRNYIRHRIIPAFSEMNPAFIKSSFTSIVNLKESGKLYNWAIREWQSKSISEEGKLIKILKTGLLTCPSPISLLFETLKPLGFNREQCMNILEDCFNKTGTIVASTSHEILIDRKFLILREIKYNKETSTTEVRAITEKLSFPGGILLFRVYTSKPAFSTNNNTVVLDYDKITYPLLIKRWEPGNKFQPLGLNGNSQKIQDFLTNLKVSKFEKQNVHLILSGGEVCWVIGYRLDERFKISAETKQFLQIKFLPD